MGVKMIKLPVYKDMDSPLEYIRLELKDEVWDKLKEYAPPLTIVEDIND